MTLPSSDALAIQAEALGKRYRLHSSPGNRLLNAVSFGRAAPHRDFWALRDFSFAVEKGEAVGVIGQNGSGKSTLLKLLAGLTLPSEGSVAVRGRIGSLIELGTGFNPEFTGRANARLSATLLGMSPDEIERKFPEIEKFAAIGEFIDRPVKTYSSGMQVRLAFSVAIAVEPEIMLIDEALAVGDLLFQQKCMRRLKELRANGVTLVMVTHDLAAVKNFCDRAYLLDAGRCVASGPTAQVVDEYNALIQKRGLEGTEQQIVSASAAGSALRHGSYEAVITSLTLLDGRGEAAAALTAGAEAEFIVRVAFLEAVEDPVIGILIRDRLTNPIFGTNSGLHHLRPGRFNAGEALTVSFRMKLELGPGEYSVTAAAHTDTATFATCFDWADDLLAFKVLPTEPGFMGSAKLNPEILIARDEAPGENAEAAFARLFTGVPAAFKTGDEAAARQLVAGFNPVESSPSGDFRWCGERAAFVLSPAGDALEIEAMIMPPPGGETRITVAAGSHALTPQIITEPGWHTLRYALPAQLPHGAPCRFVLTIEPPFIPAERDGSEDSRRLGIAIRAISGR